jgi:cation transporter-like permease
VQLIVYYVVFMVAGDFVDYVIGLAVERVWPQASLLTFLLLYFVSLWVAWLLAVRMTEPKAVEVRATAR